MLYTYDLPADDIVDHDELRAGLQAFRTDSDRLPAASIVIPVNAKGDQDNVFQILGDLTDYAGSHTFEVLLIVNNYPPDTVPQIVETLSRLDLKVFSIPSVRKHGEAVPLSARMIGTRNAKTENIIHFDADCRILNATALLDWYVAEFGKEAKVAYTQVGFYDIRDSWPNRVRTLCHFFARWVKRTIMRVPTTRGSNYAVNRTMQIEAYEAGMLADELNVGPTIKAAGGRVVFSNAKELLVLTSGRMFTGRSWLRLFKYLNYRFRYNLRLLPVRAGAAARSGRERDPDRCYVDNQQVIEPQSASIPK